MMNEECGRMNSLILSFIISIPHFFMEQSRDDRVFAS